MTRRIITRSLQSRTGEPVDGYATRIVKYIPADVVAAWIAVSGLFHGTDTRTVVTLWCVFAILLLLTPLWTLRVTMVPNRKPAATQAAVSTASFAVWVFATGVPFSHYSFYTSALGSAVLVLFTVASGALLPDTRDEVDERASP